MTANLTEQGFLQLCSPDCRLSFLRRWLNVHLQECKRIGEGPSLINMPPGLPCMTACVRLATRHGCSGSMSALLLLPPGKATQAVPEMLRKWWICSVLCCMHQDAAVMCYKRVSVLGGRQASGGGRVWVSAADGRAQRLLQDSVRGTRKGKIQWAACSWCAPQTSLNSRIRKICFLLNHAVWHTIYLYCSLPEGQKRESVQWQDLSWHMQT